MTTKTKVAAKALERPLYAIADEIRRDYRKQGKPVYFAAVPYLDAMGSLDTLDDSFFEDSAVSVVNYLLSNLGTYRGETARRVKDELNAALADRRAHGGRMY